MFVIIFIRYFGGNCIIVIEGLDKLENFQELYIENQRMLFGEKFLFDLRIMRVIFVGF